LLERGPVCNRDLASLDADDAGALPVAQAFVYALASRPGEIAKLALRVIRASAL
jgi:hypothetical protein